MKTLLLLLFTALFYGNSSFASTTTQDIKPWPNGIVPFIIEPNIPSKVKKDIQNAINRINSLNIVSFKDVSSKETNTASLLFTYKRGYCSSGFGWRGETSTQIKISEDCTYGNILHEIMHSLGMVHEQLNPLISFSINFDRITTSMEDQFEVTNAIALTPHDPQSIMHYSSTGFTICDSLSDPKWSSLPNDRLPELACRNPNWKTLKPKTMNGDVDCILECAVFLDANGKLIEGQRHDLSSLDIQGLRILYNKM